MVNPLETALGLTSLKRLDELYEIILASNDKEKMSLIIKEYDKRGLMVPA